MKVPSSVIQQGANAVEDHMTAQLPDFAWVPLVDTMQGFTGNAPELSRMLVAVSGAVDALKFTDVTISAEEPVGLNSVLVDQGHDVRFFGTYDYFSDLMRGMFAVGHRSAHVEFVREARVPQITALLLPRRKLLGFSPRSSIGIELVSQTKGDLDLVRGIGLGAAGTALTRYIIKGSF